MSLERHFSDNGNVLTIVLDQKFDFGKVQDFRAAYSDETDKVKQIVIDLKNTEYMDSSALGMLLNMQKSMSATVDTFKIVHARAAVLKILKISRFDKKFDIA